MNTQSNSLFYYIHEDFFQTNSFTHLKRWSEKLLTNKKAKVLLNQSSAEDIYKLLSGIDILTDIILSKDIENLENNASLLLPLNSYKQSSELHEKFTYIHVLYHSLDGTASKQDLTDICKSSKVEKILSDILPDELSDESLEVSSCNVLLSKFDYYSTCEKIRQVEQKVRNNLKCLIIIDSSFESRFKEPLTSIERVDVIDDKSLEKYSEAELYAFIKPYQKAILHMENSLKSVFYSDYLDTLEIPFIVSTKNLSPVRYGFYNHQIPIEEYCRDLSSKSIREYYRFILKFANDEILNSPEEKMNPSSRSKFCKHLYKSNHSCFFNIEEFAKVPKNPFCNYYWIKNLITPTLITNLQKSINPDSEYKTTSTRIYKFIQSNFLKIRGGISNIAVGSIEDIQNKYYDIYNIHDTVTACKDLLEIAVTGLQDGTPKQDALIFAYVYGIQNNEHSLVNTILTEIDKFEHYRALPVVFKFISFIHNKEPIKIDLEDFDCSHLKADPCHLLAFIFLEIQNKNYIRAQEALTIFNSNFPHFFKSRKRTHYLLNHWLIFSMILKLSNETESSYEYLQHKVNKDLTSFEFQNQIVQSIKHQLLPNELLNLITY
tara:strand:- start:1825 stop:3633 length:1809 start_codon:yes stop_codon:yes gene_type:complete